MRKTKARLKKVASYFMGLNSQVLLVYGPVGSGKSSRAQQIADRAKVNGYKVYGVISRRVVRGKETIGYNGYFPNTSEVIKLVYKEAEVNGEQWKTLKGPFLYNEVAFQYANDSLIEGAHLMDEKTLVIADEYGHLEARGYGLFLGITKVIGALNGGGKLLVLCRTDKVDDFLRLIHNKTKVLIIEADRRDFWDSMGDSFI